MNILAVLHVVSIALILQSLVMSTAVPVGWIMGDSTIHLEKMLLSAAIPLVAGLLFAFLTQRKKHAYGIREGFGIVAFSWIAAGIAGAIPYWMVENFTIYDAFFETVSGFTTTGATVIDPTMRLRDGTLLSQGIEGLSYAILYWRSMTHWLGGMGFVILSMAIFPFLGLGTQNLFRAESTGPTASQLTPRITSAAKLLWGIYLLLTIILTILLRAAEMSWFDAWCHACSTLATGGFSTKQASVAYYNSASINAILGFFMYLSGINFILHVRFLRGEPLIYFRDEEWRWYTVMIGTATLMITFVLWWTAQPLLLTSGITIPATLSNCMEHTVFSVIAVITTTGFGTVDFGIWSWFTIIVLLFLMLAGGCGGSTSGGLKQSRLIILVKYGIAQISYCLFPHAKSNIRVNDARIESGAVYKTLGFFVLFVMICGLSTLAIQGFCTFDPEMNKLMNFDTAVSLSLSCISNVGPALGHASPSFSYGWLPESVKILLSFVMIVGRLEFFTLLVLFLPSFWRK